MEINASVEINEEQTNENRRRLFIKARCNKGVSHHHLCVAETQRQTEWENFRVKKGKALNLLLLEPIGWRGDTGTGLQEAGHPVWVRGT